jgi:hypothetical protein
MAISSHSLLYPWGRSARYPLDRRLGGPQSRSGLAEEKSVAPWDWLYRLHYSNTQKVYVNSELKYHFLASRLGEMKMKQHLTVHIQI